jgi:tetratricopeptide (TPR) repeat protein
MRKFSTYTIIIISLVFLIYKLTSRPTSILPFSPEIAAVENSFNKRIYLEKEELVNSTMESYDLENTIKIIHGLELAKEKSNSFKEYLRYMASQDYSDVAVEVVIAKKRLLPILHKLTKAEKELEDQQKLWNYFSKVNEVVIPETAAMSVNLASTNYIAAAINVSSMGVSSFKAFKEQDEVQDLLEDQIDEIEDEYISYLEFFTPIYLKYMREWDKMCINRDKAYLAIHQDKIDHALMSLEKALNLNPKDKEALILKAYCLLYMEQNTRSRPLLTPVSAIKINTLGTPDAIENKGKDDEKRIEPYSNIEKAKYILDQYIESYPERSAPALQLTGTYYYMKGDKDLATSYYDQASVEYPRQSEHLLDMLNSYKQRSYLRKSAEGSYILELYKSTMEGFGFFSPNFQKAYIESQNGNLQASKDEILKHFFRRGNQQVFDYLISDMQHCENYLSDSFDLVFKEKSFLDLEATPKMWNSSELNIKINNKSDIKLSNVRVFLCLHFTDMYKDDYEVFKLDNTISNIEANTEANFGDIEINFELYGKQKEVDKDIVSARAIIVTDEIVSWVDAKDFKINGIKEANDYYEKQEAQKSEKLHKYYEAVGLDWEKTKKGIISKSKFIIEPNLIGKDKFKVKLPRDLAVLNPLFSINEIGLEEAILPSTVKLNGPYIEIEFGYNIPENKKINFYLNSRKTKIKWNVKLDDNQKPKKITTAIL